MVVAAYPVALLILCLVCAALIATSRGYQYSFGILLARLAHVFRSIRIGIPHVGHIGLGALGDAVDSVNNFILAKLGEGIDATSHALVYVWGSLASVVTELGQTIGDLAEGTERALIELYRYTIPHVVSIATAPIVRSVQALAARVVALEHRAVSTITHTVNVVAPSLARLAARVHALEHRVVHAVTVTLPAAIDNPWPRVRGLGRELDAIKSRLRRLEKPVAAVGVGVVAGTVLGKLGLGWTRCSKVGRLGKAACGFPEGEIEALLAGALVVAGSISVVQLARDCQSFTGDVDDALRFFVRELR